jgi:hypothetical protein
MQTWVPKYAIKPLAAEPINGVIGYGAIIKPIVMVKID